MNKTAIKNYAIWARVQLIEAAKQRAFEYAITDGENDPNLEIINGRILSSEEKNQRAELISLIKQKGFEQVMEEAAYTWFNRFIALRFMEVNGYLPTKLRVFTDDNGEFKPQILKEAMTLDLAEIDREKILGLIEKQDNEELFKYLVIAQCNALSSGLPGMFGTISNWVELLFPANLLKADSIIGQMITNIPEEDWTDQVQIIGWLYQYYNSELNDYVYDGSYAKNKIIKELLPAATTIYTPDWPIRYMVENSLGRLWYEGHPDFDKSAWKYYLDEAEQKPEVEEKIKKIRAEYAQIKPEEIKVIDPCMGSGHILVYAFDVLMQIYTSTGWSERDAAKSILENNLFGLDIDDRAGQLAYFAVMMKARKHNRRILNGEVIPKVLSIQESNGIDINLEKLGPEKVVAQKLIKDLKDAKEYGSILNLSVKQEELEALKRRLVDIDEMSGYGSLIVQMESNQIINSLYSLIELAEIMIQQYDVVITNPPYLGSSRFSEKLDSYIKKEYKEGKTDLSMIMYKQAIMRLVRDKGFIAFITTSSWMFLSTFESIRKYQNENSFISSLVDFGTELFEGKVGHNPTVAWVTCKSSLNYRLTAIRLVDFCYSRRDEKESEFFNKNNKYYSHQLDFNSIPGAPVAYWLNNKIYSMYKSEKTMMDIASPKVGMQTSNNDKFLRLWYEINYDEFNGSSLGLKWIKYIKGGAYRKWYGNLDYLLYYNYSPDFILSQKNARVLDLDFLKKKKCTWTDLTSGKNSFRIAPEDSFYDISGHCFFPKEEDQYWLLGYANSSIFEKLLKIFNSTIHCQVGDVAKVIVPSVGEKKCEISGVASECVSISKRDWDSFETSWDFKKHPLI